MDTRITGNKKHDLGVQVTMMGIAEEADIQVSLLGGDKMSEADKSLVSYMTMVGGLTRMNARPESKFPRGYYDLVFEYGHLWVPAPLPKEIERGVVKECFSNALHLALANDHLTYVEGYAHSPLIPTAHAWVVDPDGKVIDNTWEKPEDGAYYGIAFDTEFAVRLVHQTGYYGLLANDWLADAQMLNGLVMDENEYGLPIAIDIAED